MRPLPPNTALEPTPVTPVSFRCGLGLAQVAGGVAQLLVVRPHSHADMNTIRWILAAPLLAYGAVVIVYHWRLLVLHIRVRFFGCHHKWESSVPLAGPIMVFLGSMIAPSPELSRYSWLSVFIDPATYTLIYSLPFLLRQVILSRHKKSI